jgi:tRNA-Thr(GGU) m(6)t(6)A37 methyltransferase TsaA
MKIEFESIGIIHTPYPDQAPFRPDPEAEGEFSITINKEYQPALQDLEKFSHIIVLFYFDRATKINLKAHPPRLEGAETGLLASRSPNRINKIGMDVVKVLGIEGNMIRTSAMDILDNTPLLDIKPYIPDLDCHPDANKGHFA